MRLSECTLKTETPFSRVCVCVCATVCALESLFLSLSLSLSLFALSLVQGINAFLTSHVKQIAAKRARTPTKIVESCRRKCARNLLVYVRGTFIEKKTREKERERKRVFGKSAAFPYTHGGLHEVFHANTVWRVLFLFFFPYHADFPISEWRHHDTMFIKKI